MQKTSVTLRSKKLKSGMLSLYLDYYPPVVIPSTAKLSRREFLKLKIYDVPENEWQHQQNESNLELAEEIRATRFLQIRNKEFGLVDNIQHNVNFHDFYNSIVDEYYNTGSKGNYHSWKASLRYWDAFAATDLESRQLTKWHVDQYRNFLLTTDNLRTNKKKLSNNTASAYYKQFIMVLKRAYKENVLSSNLAEDAKYIKEKRNIREYVSEQELAVLWKTPIKTPTVKHMAMFSAMTGLRYADVAKLEWNDVYEDTHQGSYIHLREQKTDHRHTHPISQAALKILKSQDSTEGKIFNEIPYYKVIRELKKWVEDAGINKKISFHNFRHSFAIINLSKNENIYTIKDLLGHKNITTTQIYLQSIDTNKIKAANNVNIDLDGL
jgi:integrase